MKAGIRGERLNGGDEILEERSEKRVGAESSRRGFRGGTNAVDTRALAFLRCSSKSSSGSGRAGSGEINQD